jgi:hypothetical protein
MIIIESLAVSRVRKTLVLPNLSAMLIGRSSSSSFGAKGGGMDANSSALTGIDEIRDLSNGG